MENGAQNLILLLSKNTCAFGMSIQFIYLDFWSREIQTILVFWCRFFLFFQPILKKSAFIVKHLNYLAFSLQPFSF